MTNAVEAAIAAAKEKAATTAAATTANLPAEAQQSSAPQTYTAPAARKYTVDDMSAGSMAVDGFLKVSEDGLKIGDNPALIEEIEVTIDLSEVQYCEAVSYGASPVIYKKTFDGQKAVTGENWAQVLATAKSVSSDPKKGNPFVSAEVPMTLSAEAKSMKGVLVKEVGYRVGKSLTMTEKKQWNSLIQQVKSSGLDPEKSSISVKVTAKPQVKGENKWGIIDFVLLGEAMDDVPEAETAVAETATA